mmetsp:Transcript_19474/g.46130  ORF Transcript_19474/g.46130 Transcript_19474/m.46130 type:complete len:89 (-) Transcript_19474:864-1130(-)
MLPPVKKDPINHASCISCPHTFQGRHIFAGYMGMPEKTKETISPDGWLHSGDIITIDPNDDPRIPSPSGFVKVRFLLFVLCVCGEIVT